MISQPFPRQAFCKLPLWHFLGSVADIFPGVLRTAQIYELTFPPCLTDLSVSPGSAQESESSLPDVTDGTSLSGLFVYWERMHSISPLQYGKQLLDALHTVDLSV